MPRIDLIQYRGGTTAEWQLANPVLASREVGFDTTANEIRVGNGFDVWTDLEPLGAAAFEEVQGEISGLTSRTVTLEETIDTGRLSEPQLNAAFVQGGKEVREMVTYLLPGEKVPSKENGVTNAYPILLRIKNAMRDRFIETGVAQVCRVPAGTYDTVNQALWVESGIGFWGEGEGRTIFLAPVGTSFFGAAPLANPWVGSPRYEYLYFRDFTIDGRNQPAEVWHGQQKGFAIGHAWKGVCMNVTVENTESTGIGMDNADDFYFANVTARNCGRGMKNSPLESRIGAGSGFGIGVSTQAVQGYHFVNCFAYENGSNGFFFEMLDRKDAKHKSVGVKLVGCHSEGNAVGLTDSGCAGFIATGSSFVNNLLAGIRVGTTHTGRQGGVRGTISACTISGNLRGVQFDGTAEGGYEVIANAIFGNVEGGVVIPDTDITVPGRGLRVISNQIYGNGGPGILCETTKPVPDFQIIDNDIRGNGHSADAEYSDGITFVSPMLKPTVRGNTLRGNKGNPIAFRGAATSVSPRVSLNDWDGSMGGGLVIEHTIADQSHIVDNIGNSVTTVTNLVTVPRPVSGGGWTSQATTGAAYGVDPEVGEYWEATASTQTPRMASSVVTVTPGQVYSGRIKGRGPEGQRCTLYVMHHATWVQIADYTASGDWDDLELPAHLIPAGVTALRIGYGLKSATSGTSKIAVSNAQLTLSPDAWDYFDGSKEHAAWSGAANASTSVYTIPSDAGTPPPEPVLPSTYKNLTTTPVPRVGGTGQVASGVTGNTRHDTGGPFGNGYMSSTTTAANPKLGSAAIAVTEGQVYNVSCYMKAPLGTSVRGEAWHGAAQVYGSAVPATGEWQRVSYVTTIPSGITALRAGGSGVSFGTGVGVEFSAHQITAGPDLLPYVDGAQPDCVWDGTPYASTSTYTKP